MAVQNASAHPASILSVNGTIFLIEVSLYIRYGTFNASSVLSISLYSTYEDYNRRYDFDNWSCMATEVLLASIQKFGRDFSRYLIMNSPSPNSSVSQLDAEEQCTKSTLI